MVQGQYFDLKKTKTLLDITDTVDDSRLSDLGINADQQIETDLFAFVDVFPLIGEIAKLATQAAKFWVSAIWKADQKAKDLSDFYNKSYKSTIDQIKIQLKATPTGRTKRISSTTKFTTNQLFAQTKR